MISRGNVQCFFSIGIKNTFEESFLGLSFFGGWFVLFVCFFIEQKSCDAVCFLGIPWVGGAPGTERSI